MLSMEIMEGCNIDLGFEYVGKENMKVLAKELISALSTDPWMKKGIVQYGNKSVIVKNTDNGMQVDAIFDGRFVEVTNHGALDKGPKENAYNIIVNTIMQKRRV